MSLNFPDPGTSTVYTVDGVTYNYNGTKGYWSTSSIDAGGGTPNDSVITLSAGTGLSGGGNFTTNQSSNETITFNADLNELTTSTTDGDGDYFVVVDTSGNQRKLSKGNINISGFNNNSGFITASSTATLTNKSGNISQWTNDSGYITSADGGNAATLDNIDSSQFLRSDTADTATGNLVFDGSIRINNTLLDAGGGAGTSGQILSSTGTGVDWIDSSQFLRSDTADTATGNLVFDGSIRVNNTLLDAGGGAGSSGQILSSTGSGVDWIDAPSGGGALNDLSDVTITSPSSGQVLKYNGSAWVNGTDETGGGGGGITTGKAIAMAMVFG